VPTYDYQCRSCGHTIEVIHSMLEEGPTTCEVCGGDLRRILHPAGIIFRGSGFYKTDSRSASSASVPSGTAKVSGSSTDGASSKGSEGKGSEGKGSGSSGSGTSTNPGSGTPPKSD
jgi:putative FmdB family regulatory protein